MRRLVTAAALALMPVVGLADDPVPAAPLHSHDEIDLDLPPVVTRLPAPLSQPRRVAIGSDHTGIAMKKAILQHLRGRGLLVLDQGTHTTEPVDYPDVAALVARAVARGEADAGIVIDGAGIGSAIAANKIRGVRAAMCTDETIARYSREHNGANVMTLGSTVLAGNDAAIRITDTWLGTSMREARYIRRLLKVRRLEENPE